MTARRVEEAGDRLRKLRQDEWSELALAGLAMGLALGATALHPPLALAFLRHGDSGFGARLLLFGELDQQSGIAQRRAGALTFAQRRGREDQPLGQPFARDQLWWLTALARLLL